MDLAKARMQFVTAVLLYGTIGPLTRFIDVPSEVIVLVRGSFGALLVLLFQLARGRTPDIAAIRDNLGWLVASGICLGLNWVFLFAAYAHTTVAIASLCNYMAPIIVIAISPVVFKERIGPRRLACILAALVDSRSAFSSCQRVLPRSPWVRTPLRPLSRRHPRLAPRFAAGRVAWQDACVGSL